LSFAAEGNDEPTKPTILRWAYDIVAKTGRYDLTCQEWRQFDSAKKDWEKIKLHFKVADRDMRSQDTTDTFGYHVANATTSNATLLATTQAALAASEIQLAQALSQSCLSSSSHGSNRSTVTTTTRVSAITDLDTRQTWTTRAPHASTQTMDTKLMQPCRTGWEEPTPSLSLVDLIQVADQEGRQHLTS
jgi:hypothetical protein